MYVKIIDEVYKKMGKQAKKVILIILLGNRNGWCEFHKEKQLTMLIKRGKKPNFINQKMNEKIQFDIFIMIWEFKAGISNFEVGITNYFKLFFTDLDA